jgi:3-methyladenine DNA glycosylase AlkD
MNKPAQSGNAASIRDELKAMSDPEKARVLLRFFKTGPGEYGAGDRFLGVITPKVRKVVKANWATPPGEIRKLIRSSFHEERLAALLIMVEKFHRGDSAQKRQVFDLYLANTAFINNWDLVDLTAPHIVGAYLADKDTAVLTRLAYSKSLWERRIAMLATFHFIREGDAREALRIAELLLKDNHDLIHKAVGWMLREVGKRCSLDLERRFLDAHAVGMPRTMLRYAIERFPEKLRLQYLQKTKENLHK